jgi:homoserine O-acetyltransferase
MTMSLTDRCGFMQPQPELPAPEPGARRGELRFVLPLRYVGPTAVVLRYELIGRGERLLLVGGGISAGRHVLASASYPESGWWQAQAAPFDLTRHSLLAIDWIGADGNLDVPIDASDQADAIVALLDQLGAVQAEAFIGSSYGGMVALHFAARHPSRCGRILVISAAASAHPFASACRSLQRRAISLGEAAGDTASGVALARAMAMLTYRTPAEFGERFTEAPRVDGERVRVAADAYLDLHGRRHAERMSPSAYRRLSESIDLHRIDPEALAVPATFVAVDSDALVPLGDVEALAAATAARFRLIRSKFGHDAFLKEAEQVAAIITEFLETSETQE